MLPPLLLLSLLSLFALSVALPPPSLQLSLGLPPTNSTPPPPITKPYPTTCYIPSPLTHVITKHDCYLALNNLLAVPDLTDPMLWSARLSHRAVQARWRGGDCIIEIVALMPMAQDIFSLLDVSVGAFQIVDACGGAGGGGGARQGVGKKRVFQVVVMHKDGLRSYSPTLGVQGGEGSV